MSMDLSAPMPDDYAADAVESAAGGAALTAQYTRKLWFWLGLSFLLHLFLLHFPYEFTLDVNTFRSWTGTLVQQTPLHFYDHTWSDYPPLFMDFLWLWGLIQLPITHSAIPSETWMKLPACLADIVNGYLIFTLLKGRVAIRSAFKTAVFYTFNPVVLFVSCIWGQVDAIISMMMLLIMVAVLLNWLIPAAVACAAALLVKPQGLFMWPVVFQSLWYKQPLKKWPLAILAGTVTVWAIVVPSVWGKLGGVATLAGGLPLPAFLVEPFFWLASMMNQTGQNYPYSTVNAFNIWMLPPPNETWKPDSRILFFLPHYWWGILLMSALIVLVGVYLYRNRNVAGVFPYFLAAAVTTSGVYMLMTRMHERYIFAAIAFLALAAACNRRMRWIYWGFSLTSFLTISYVFFYYNDKSAWVEGLKSVMDTGPMIGNLKLSGAVILSLVNIWLFGELVSYLFARGEMVQDVAEYPLVRQLRTMAVSVKTQAIAWADYLIAGAYALGFFTLATWRLGVPNEEIFDEVYHARTGMEYIAGVNPYEWTHPPLAKLLVAVGILLFHGEFSLQSKVWTVAQAFDWRFMSVVFGSLTLLVVYALTRSMFENRAIATMATGLLALDGVFFVQSRVAMTNIYEVCFIMVATLGAWLYLKTTRDRWLFVMALGLGGALSSRWSTLYGWGGLGLLWLWYLWTVKRYEWGAEPDPQATTAFDKLRTSLARMQWRPALNWLGLGVLVMFVIPAVIYLITYIPYVLQGGGSWQLHLFNWNYGDHGWGKVIAQQHDMYEYHAHLNATHPYSSPWWSWPFMLRPTWYYFHDWKNGTLSGVWAIGNAFVWWASVPALAYAAFLAWRDKNRALGLVSLLGFSQWVIWGIQPRPLLYMHYYFETVPFACIAIAYVCYQFWQAPDGEPGVPLGQKLRRGLVSGYLAAVVACFAFFYPLLSALPISWMYYNWHLWFGRCWI